MHSTIESENTTDRLFIKEQAEAGISVASANSTCINLDANNVATTQLSSTKYDDTYLLDQSPGIDPVITSNYYIPSTTPTPEPLLTTDLQNNYHQENCDPCSSNSKTGTPSHTNSVEPKIRTKNFAGKSNNSSSHPSLSIASTRSNTKQNLESPIELPLSPTSTRSIVFAVLFYLVTSIAMVILNKAILNVFALPLTLLWIQLVFSAAILKLFQLLRIISPFSTITLRTLIKLSPLILINVLGLTMNTLCLQYLDASLYQVTRALILPFTVIFTAMILHNKSSIPVIVSCGIVSSGFLIGIFLEQNVHISMIGILFGIVSSMTSAIHSIIIKRSLGIIDGALDLVYYNNLLSAILLFPMIFIEAPGIIGLFVPNGNNPLSSSISTAGMFLIGSILAGICGLLINLAGFLQIKVTSPITHTLSSASRGVIQTILAVIILGEIITSYRIISIVITIIGTIMYTWVRSLECKREALFKQSKAKRLTNDIESVNTHRNVNSPFTQPEQNGISIEAKSTRINTASIFGQTLRPIIKLPTDSMITA